MGAAVSGKQAPIILAIFWGSSTKHRPIEWPSCQTISARKAPQRNGNVVESGTCLRIPGLCSPHMRPTERTTVLPLPIHSDDNRYFRY